jgi:single-strand DNA-binding protein
LYVEGRLRGREWEKDGVKHFGVEIVADEVKLLGRRQEGAPQGGYQQSQQGGYQQSQQNSFQQPQYQQPAAPQAPVIPNDDPDDMPF